MNPPTLEPPCLTCGSTPASLIEDVHSIDLVPWWKYYAQQFNPFRLIRRTTEIRWIPMGENDQAIWSHQAIAVKMWREDNVDSAITSDITINDLTFVSHWCPLPPLP